MASSHFKPSDVRSAVALKFVYLFLFFSILTQHKIMMMMTTTTMASITKPTRNEEDKGGAGKYRETRRDTFLFLMFVFHREASRKKRRKMSVTSLSQGQRHGPSSLCCMLSSSPSFSLMCAYRYRSRQPFVVYSRYVTAATCTHILIYVYK